MSSIVITTLVGSIPFIGADILYLLWGSFSAEGATLSRFFTMHFLFPFLILIATALHLRLLHENGSSNPLGISSTMDETPFVPYYAIKDLFSIVILLILFVYIIVIVPDPLGHCDIIF